MSVEISSKVPFIAAYFAGFFTIVRKTAANVLIANASQNERLSICGSPFVVGTVYRELVRGTDMKFFLSWNADPARGGDPAVRVLHPLHSIPSGTFSTPNRCIGAAQPLTMVRTLAYALG
jgi:hypothetical protein